MESLEQSDTRDDIGAAAPQRKLKVKRRFSGTHARMPLRGDGITGRAMRLVVGESEPDQA